MFMPDCEGLLIHFCKELHYLLNSFAIRYSNIRTFRQNPRCSRERDTFVFYCPIFTADEFDFRILMEMEIVP
jgi:hypothetical protein